ncbi:MAG: glycosyltransferase family 4 protein [Calothrix sp. C42_A2020_038]|nr:glycosyltransferase family 4 protein [Calothrix sp. C42_A2020_038]
MRIGYLIPEFPGQTHVWIWREICHMREWGTAIDIFSTKQPSPDITARHDFATHAQAQTYYLWKQDIFQQILDIFIALCWTILTRPYGLLKTILLALTIDVDARPRWRSTLPLVPIACILARQAVALGIEHMHCHSCANSAILAMMLKRLTRISYSLTLNANLEWWGGALAAKFGDAEFTVVITRWLETQVRNRYPHLRSDQVVLGRIGVDTTKWTPQSSHVKNQTNNQTFQIITVGRLHASKGHDTLIRSVKHLIDAGKSVKLKIIGAGPEADNLKAMTGQLQMSDLIHFTGSLSENQIIEEMRHTDAFVLASHAEPLGVVYMEAMAMEVATIGTNAGGVPEIITDTQDGLLIPPRDDIALERALTQLIENPSLKNQLGQAGRQTIVQRFDSRIGAATLYQRLFGHSPILI